MLCQFFFVNLQPKQLYTEKMDLIYDNIVFAIQNHGGVSVVWEELLNRAGKELDAKYIDVDTTKVNNYNRKRIDIPNDKIISKISCSRISRYMPVRLSSDKSFIFHSSYYRYCTNRNAINITTVHDFTYELFRSGLQQKVHTWQKFSAIRHSDAVVCISENTKRDLLRLLPDVDESKVYVIYNGISEKFHQLHENTAMYQLPFSSNSYLIFIGRRDEYKNFDIVVKALSKTKWNLLIIGSQLNKNEENFVQSFLPKERYKCVSNIDDEILNLYYNYAAALLYPSSYEGFGLPVLEAQRAGCPVIAYNASSIPEVIGCTPLLIDNLTEAEIVSKINLLNDVALIEDIKIEGLRNVQRFSWDKMAQQYIELYNEVGNRQ